MTWKQYDEGCMFILISSCAFFAYESKCQCLLSFGISCIVLLIVVKNVVCHTIVMKHVHCISCSFLSWQCVQAAYDKFCELSPSSSIHIKGLLAYLPSLWISGSTDECTETIRSAKNILQTMRTENVSYRICF